MWRAFFMATGLSMILLGGEFLVADRLIFAGEQKPAAGGFFATPAKRREFVPPEWAPWTLLSVGSIAILYGITLPKAGGGGGGGEGGG